MAFNFSIASVQPANTTSYLKPYTINDNVVIKSIEVKEGVGKTSGNPWKSLNITFGNDEGIYNDSIFYIDPTHFQGNNPKAAERPTFDQPNGGKREAPSEWEVLRDKMAAIGFAFNPDGFKKLQELSIDLTKNDGIEKLMAGFKKILEKVIGQNPTRMKLVGRNNNGTVYATLPKCTGIAQATEKTASSNGVNVGDWYTWMSTPFGDKVSFSAYEESQKNTLNSAKPTNMDTIATQVDGKGSEDLDFDSLL